MPITTDIKLPDSEETIAYRSIDSILRNDTLLKRVIKTYVTWDGSKLDGQEPTASMCPYLMIVPSSRPSGWQTEGQHAEPMQVGIYAAIVGSDANQIMNLWGAIRLALFPRDLAAQDAIRVKVTDAGITQGEITMPAYTVKVDTNGESGTIMAATGTLELYLLINT
jgi:hypothetical protein